MAKIAPALVGLAAAAVAVLALDLAALAQQIKVLLEEMTTARLLAAGAVLVLLVRQPQHQTQAARGVQVSHQPSRVRP